MRIEEGGRSSTNQLVVLSPAIHNNETRIKNANSEKVNELVSTLTVVLLEGASSKYKNNIIGILPIVSVLNVTNSLGKVFQFA